MILYTIYDLPLTSVLFVSVTLCNFWFVNTQQGQKNYGLKNQNSNKYVPCAINYLYQRCLVMGVRPTGFYNVAKNRSDIYSWRDQSRTVISIKVSWILMSGLIVVNGPLTITWSVLTQKHMIFYSLSLSPHQIFSSVLTPKLPPSQPTRTLVSTLRFLL